MLLSSKNFDSHRLTHIVRRSADSFFEKEPEEHRPSGFREWRSQTLDPCSVAAPAGLAPSEFSYERAHSIAFYEALRDYEPPQFPQIKPGQICVTWIGHASFLIQTHEVNLLIDPNWSKWLKVIKRLKKPGFEIHHLPEIDLVLVTHAHFDHLDRRTLRKVAADQPIVVPIGVGNLVHDLGFHIVHELDYWQTVRLGSVEVSLTPCYHWGARFLADLHRGFGGFTVTVDQRTIFHCGDSAFFPGFREIGERYDIDIALLPIGAYDPPTGREVHMNPEEAVRAFVELGANTLVPMHYGTFRLGYEPMNEPLERLLLAARAQNIEDKVRVMTEGKPVVL